MAETGKDTTRAAELITKGRLVAIPTETVYGLAANALNEEAVLAIFKAKQRPFFDPLIIHLPSIEHVDRYASFSDERLKRLAEHFWPGPLTLLLPKKQMVPDLVTSGLPQVAVRVPSHPLTLELLHKVEVPLAAPSANPFGYISPTEPSHVNEQLGEKIDYILDGGSSKVGLESTIVGIEDDTLCIFRLGGLTISEIEKVAGKTELRVNSSSDPRAPGQLKNHYAPRKPLYLGNIQALAEKYGSKKMAVLLFGKDAPKLNNAIIFHLSEKADMNEAAVNLFKMLRLADQSQAEIVVCEPLPEEGLGMAINDRLRRAAHR